MGASEFLDRVTDYVARKRSVHLGQRRAFLALNRPLISFAFDDFPITALEQGGAILEKYGLGGTYYVSLDLMGRPSPVGQIISTRHLSQTISRGHELGCHTFAHCHSWNTAPRVFEESILDNREALAQLLPGQHFKTLAYPIASPRPGTKVRAGKYFRSCRGGGQTYNAGRIDLNRLNGFFLEKARGNAGQVKELIKQTCQANGWLILSTHDVCEKPSPFGCTPEFFEEIVSCAVQSGARILPVAAAQEAAGGLESETGGPEMERQSNAEARK